MLTLADLVLLGVLTLLAEAAVVGLLVRRVAVSAARPWLPEADRPPAGLGRLVPVGRQLEQECAAGLLALERWLSAQRRR